jgi:hypothetical protein
MARIRIEFWDNGDNLQEAEAEHIDPHEAFERAVRMARAALPPKPTYRPPSTVIQLNNVHFTEVDQETLFGRVVAPPPTRVEPGSTLGQCQDRCPEGEVGAVPCRCKRPLNHDGRHLGDDGCSWPLDEPRACADRAFWMGGAYGCERPEGHLDHHESTLGLKWLDGGAVVWCKGRWGFSLTDPLGDGLACRLPEGHEGECGPLPEPEPEVADCA